jgi:hypothetical protein
VTGKFSSNTRKMRQIDIFWKKTPRYPVSYRISQTVAHVHTHTQTHTHTHTHTQELVSGGAADQRLFKNYFSTDPPPVYNESDFERRFHMQRAVFSMIQEKVIRKGLFCEEVANFSGKNSSFGLLDCLYPPTRIWRCGWPRQWKSWQGWVNNQHEFKVIH